MGADTLNSITFSGTARNGQFGQSKAIGNPLGPTNTTQITQYTRTINLAPPAAPTDLVSRATGPTQPPTVPGAPAPMPGVFNQNITGAQATGDNWNNALNFWTTPWAFLKGAAANNATVREQGGQQLVSFSPPNLKSPSGQMYTVTGYINRQNLVTKVETRVQHAVVGDLLHEFEYSNYQNMNGVQVPTRMVQKQAGLTTFEATITAATPNPSNLTALLTPPPAPARGGGAPGGGGAPAGGGAPGAGAPGRGGAAGAGAPGAGAPGGQGGRAAGAPAAGAPPQGGGRGGGGGQAAAAAPPPVEKLGEGAFAIGGNYLSLAVDMGDHILVVESGQSDDRGMAVMAAAKQAIPGKPIRFVVNSHPHFDHASGLAAAVAEGATILTHENNEEELERLLRYPRTLIGDSLSKAPNRRANVDGVDARDTRKGSNGKVVDLIHVPNEHSDGMLVVYLPAEKIVWSADVTGINPNPAQIPVTRAVHDTLTRLKIDYNRFMTAHPPNPDPGRPLTRDDVVKGIGTN
jgi:glyoxylase-like metal-dependent hydrolase (beta-lactamase superfamily II)